MSERLTYNEEGSSNEPYADRLETVHDDSFRQEGDSFEVAPHIEESSVFNAEESVAAESITASLGVILENTNSEKPKTRAMAAEFAVASALASNPGENPREQSGAVKRSNVDTLITGLLRGAQSVALALSIGGMELNAQVKEAPHTAATVEQVFGKSLFGLGGGRLRKHYTYLENKKAELVEKLDRLNEIVPTNDLEKAQLSVVEAKSKQELLNIHEDKVKLNRELLLIDKDDAAKLASIAVKFAEIEVRIAQAKKNYHTNSKLVHTTANGREIENIRKALSDIEREQKNIRSEHLNHNRYNDNGFFYH